MKRGAYVIRVTFKPAGFAPFVGDHAKSCLQYRLVTVNCGLLFI